MLPLPAAPVSLAEAVVFREPAAALPVPAVVSAVSADVRRRVVELGWTVTTVVPGADDSLEGESAIEAEEAVELEDEADDPEEPDAPPEVPETADEDDPELEPVVPLELPVVPLLLPLLLPVSGLPPTMAPVPHPIACPSGCVGFGAGTVVPSAAAMVKRVVYVAGCPFCVNW